MERVQVHVMQVVASCIRSPNVNCVLVPVPCSFWCVSKTTTHASQKGSLLFANGQIKPKEN